jgi:chorismate synthase
MSSTSKSDKKEKQTSSSSSSMTNVDDQKSKRNTDEQKVFAGKDVCVLPESSVVVEPVMDDKTLDATLQHSKLMRLYLGFVLLLWLIVTFR